MCPYCQPTVDATDTTGGVKTGSLTVFDTFVYCPTCGKMVAKHEIHQCISHESKTC